MVATTASSLPGVARGAKPVTFITPPKDKKLYRRITLPNGLLAILISDPEMANQVGGGSESEEDMSEEEGHSEDEEDNDEVQQRSSRYNFTSRMPVIYVVCFQDDQSDKDGSDGPSALVKKAAAAMAVGVGSFKDPDQLQVCSWKQLCC